jgi:hypothetical protein
MRLHHRWLWTIGLLLIGNSADATPHMDIGVQWMGRASSGSLAPAAATTSLYPNGVQITDHGGPLLSRPVIVPVLWGPDVRNTTSLTQSFYPAITASGPLVHFLSQYGRPSQSIGAMTLLPAVTLPTDPPTPLVDETPDPSSYSDIAKMLFAQIQSGTLPPATPNTLYVVHLPPGVDVHFVDATTGAVYAQSCVPHPSPGVLGFCAYHSSDITGTIAYAVIPDFSSAGGCGPQAPGVYPACGDQSETDNETTAVSHEILEAVTDPEPAINPAWTDNRSMGVGEIADPCAYNFLFGDGTREGEAAYTPLVTAQDVTTQAQKTWSNAQGACVGYPATTFCCESSKGSGCPLMQNGAGACSYVGWPSPEVGATLLTTAGSGTASMNTVAACELCGQNPVTVHTLVFMNERPASYCASFSGAAAANAPLDVSIPVYAGTKPGSAWACDPNPSGAPCPGGGTALSTLYSCVAGYAQPPACCRHLPEHIDATANIDHVSFDAFGATLPSALPPSSVMSAPALGRFGAVGLAFGLGSLGLVRARQRKPPRS